MTEIKPGMLVKITRASIGAPIGTVAFVQKIEWREGLPMEHILFSVRLFTGSPNNRSRRYYGSDLEIFS